MIKKFFVITRNIYDTILRYGLWNIGIVHEPIHNFLKPDFRPKIHWIPPKKGRYFADPFGIVKKNKLIIIYEEFNFNSAKGAICSIEVDNKTISQPKVVINSPVSISYPYLFEHKKEIYCIPEAHQTNEISLYKAQKFPEKWKKVKTLIKDIGGIDNTVFQYNGKWWLMHTKHDKSINSDLFVWCASDLFGEWKPHSNNPVKRDMGSARPAGTPFIHNGYLYRPSQDCSKTYGGRIIINKVITLTPSEFKEEQAAVIEPFEPYLDGTHTISSAGDITIIDGKKMVVTNKNMFKYRFRKLLNDIKK